MAADLTHQCGDTKLKLKTKLFIMVVTLPIWFIPVTIWVYCVDLYEHMTGD